MPSATAVRVGQAVAPGDGGFEATRAACRASGGMARADHLAHLLEDRLLGDFISLARMIVSGSLLGFEWQHCWWVPMFQFDPTDMAIVPGPQRVIAELRPAFDAMAIADWFVQPNTWLTGQRPVDLLNRDLHAVLQAARADRFIAIG